MNCTLRFSEAFTLGLHATCYLACREGGRASVREIASYLGGSEAHLAKVMHRLVRDGLLKSSRGPGGGFILSRESKEISLMDIYESLEGPFTPTTCLLGRDSCLGRACIMRGLVDAVNRRFESYMRKTDLRSASMMLAGKRGNSPGKVKGFADNRDARGADGPSESGCHEGRRSREFERPAGNTHTATGERGKKESAGPKGTARESEWI